MPYIYLIEYHLEYPIEDLIECLVHMIAFVYLVYPIEYPLQYLIDKRTVWGKSEGAQDVRIPQLNYLRTHWN